MKNHSTRGSASRTKGRGRLTLDGLRGVAQAPIFITGHGDIPMSVQAMKAGAYRVFDEAIRRRCAFECHPERHRAQPGHTWPPCGDASAPELLCVTHTS